MTSRFMLSAAWVVLIINFVLGHSDTLTIINVNLLIGSAIMKKLEERAKCTI